MSYTTTVWQYSQAGQQADTLMHYGIKGQKWGVRNYRNMDGTLTAEGRSRYGVNGRSPGSVSMYSQARVRTASAPRERSSIPNSSRSAKSALTPEQIQARKARTRKYLKIAGGIALASLATYGAIKGYKKSTELRDQMRDDVLKTVNTDHKNVHTLNSKYWTTADRNEYRARSEQRAKDMASGIRRRDAVASKFTSKTGIRISFRRSRQETLRARRSENEYANFIRGAENRASINRSIHDARRDLKKQIESRNTYANMHKIGTSKQYETLFLQKRDENIEAAKQRLDDLLKKRTAA